MRRGARGYLPKPWDNEALIEIVRREVDEGRAARRAEAHATRELDRRPRHPAGAPAERAAGPRRRRSGGALGAGVGVRRRLLRRDADRRRRGGGVHRRRLRQGPAGGAADVERPGDDARVHDARRRARGRGVRHQPRAVPPRRARPLRHAVRVDLRPADADAPLLQRRPQSAGRGPRRRACRPAHRRRARRRRVRDRALRRRRDRPRARRSRCACSPTACPRRARHRAPSSATSGSSRW